MFIGFAKTSETYANRLFEIGKEAGLLERLMMDEPVQLDLFVFDQF